jgi:hypothetical protein
MLGLFGIREAVAATETFDKPLHENVVLWQVSVYELDDFAACRLSPDSLGQCISLESWDVKSISEDIYLCQKHVPLVVVILVHHIQITIWKGSHVGPSDEHIN